MRNDPRDAADGQLVGIRGDDPGRLVTQLEDVTDEPQFVARGFPRGLDFFLGLQELLQDRDRVVLRDRFAVQIGDGGHERTSVQFARMINSQ
jgi:hypothetical protein